MVLLMSRHKQGGSGIPQAVLSFIDAVTSEIDGYKGTFGVLKCDCIGGHQNIT